MKVIAEFTVIPIGVGVSLSGHVAICEDVFQERAIIHSLHANGTNLEGEWEEVMGAIYECHKRLHRVGTPRIATFLKISTRIDREQTMGQKVDSVMEKITIE